MPEQDRPKIGLPDRARLGTIARPPESVVRVLWSSGTTGSAKGTALTRALQMYRAGISGALHAHLPTSRQFVAMGFPTVYGYNSMIAVLTGGGALVLPNAAGDFLAMARSVGVTTMGVNVAMLTELVGQEGNLLRRMEQLQIDVMGSHLPVKLAQDARYFLTPNIRSIYGTTEALTIASGDASLCIADASAIGYVAPSVDVQFVDPEDRPLAVGEEGILRVRGAQIAYGYYGNEAATRSSFRDGWFYPGDVGWIDGEGLLRVTGRSDDVTRRGQRAISPLPIETAIAALPGVREAAVFPLAVADGEPQACVALVLEPGTRADAVLAEARRRLGQDAPTISLVLDALPRNANGKVVKRALAKLAGEARDSARVPHGHRA